jgi:trans-aconitate 2-methyltransferase
VTAEEFQSAPRPAEHANACGRATYSFGDVDAAAVRLQLLDRVFAPPTRAVLEVAASAGVGLAVDLGCGPGFSTRAIAEQLRPERLVGLEISESFLRWARDVEPSATWFAHDVTSVPFPTGGADVLHARFVLSHLARPESVVLAWLSQLNRGGYLLAQDDEQIVTSVPALVAYEEMARSLVTQRGGDLWVGARLAQFVPPPDFAVVLSRVYRHSVPAALAAQMFGMNFAVWRHDPFVVQDHSVAVLDALGEELDDLAGRDDPREVIFEIRQLAYRRR